MNRLITLTKAALVSSLLASGLAGCGIFSNGDDCCKRDCNLRHYEALRKSEAPLRRVLAGLGATDHASMTLGVGTDGLSVGSESNVGSHGVSGSISTH